MNFSLFLCILHQIPRITRMPRVSDQIVAVLNHVAVRPDDSGAFGDHLHPWRIECSIETERCGCRAIIRMIGKQQSERHLEEFSVCQHIQRRDKQRGDLLSDPNRHREWIRPVPLFVLADAHCVGDRPEPAGKCPTIAALECSHKVWNKLIL